MEAHMNDTTPDEMRAARDILKQYMLDDGIFRTAGFAAIIDRETGLPELVEACSDLLYDIDTTTQAIPYAPAVGRLREALGKVKG